MKLYWIDEWGTQINLGEGDVIKETDKTYFYQGYFRQAVLKSEMQHKGIHLSALEAWTSYQCTQEKSIQRMQQQINSAEQKLAYASTQIEALKKEDTHES